MRDKPRLASPRRAVWALLGGVLIVAGAAYVLTLPLRQTQFQVVDHELTIDRSNSSIQGQLRNRGAAAQEVLVEAYLYDEENRYLGTVRTTARNVAEDGASLFQIPVEPDLARRVARYSLYAGTELNPYAPDR